MYCSGLHGVVHAVDGWVERLLNSAIVGRFSATNMSDRALVQIMGVLLPFVILTIC